MLHEDLFSPWRKNVFITVKNLFHHGGNTFSSRWKNELLPVVVLIVGIEFLTTVCFASFKCFENELLLGR